MAVFNGYVSHYQRVSPNASRQNHPAPPSSFPSTSSPSSQDANPRAAAIRQIRVGGVEARAAVGRPGAQRIIVHHARGHVGVLIHRRGLEVIKTCRRKGEGTRRGLGFNICKHPLVLKYGWLENPRTEWRFS